MLGRLSIYLLLVVVVITVQVLTESVRDRKFHEHGSIRLLNRDQVEDNHLLKKPKYVFSEEDAVRKHGTSLVDKVYLYDGSFGNEDHSTRAAYIVAHQEGDVHDHKLKIVDGSSNDLLLAIPMMHYEANAEEELEARVFTRNAQNPAFVQLQNLDSSSRLSGKYHRTANNCPFYVCDPNGKSTLSPSVCDIEDVVCFDSGDVKDIHDFKDLIKLDREPEIQQASVKLRLDARVIHDQFASNGIHNNTIHLEIRNLPVLGQRARRDSVKDLKMDASSDKDDFSEVQIYYWGQVWREFVLGMFDSEFCSLSEFSNDCAELNSTIFNLNGSVSELGFEGPFWMASNMKQLRISPQLIDSHSKKGLGKSAENPIVLNGTSSLINMDNAFFYWNPEGLKLNSTKCLNGSCITYMGNVRVPLLGFGQGLNGIDWALDDCVAYHELTHALTHRLVPYLASVVRSRYGVSSDPGAMNEGWSDYFAAIQCNETDFSKSYSRRVRRTVVNTMRSCSSDKDTDVRGEIHYDSQIFSGALWEARSLYSSAFERRKFDTVVLVAQSSASIAELFKDQFEKILALVKDHTVLSPKYEQVRKIFKERDLDCEFRISEFRSEYASATLPPLGDSGTVDYVASPVQFKFNIPAIPAVLSSDQVAVTWSQYQNHGLFGRNSIGYATKNLFYTYSWKCPIRFEFKDRKTIPIESCTNKTLPILEASTSKSNFNYYFSAVQGWAEISKSEDSMNSESVHFFVLHDSPVQIVLQDITARYQWHGLDLVAIIVSAVVFTLMSVGFLSIYRGRILKDITNSSKLVRFDDETEN